MSAPRIVEVSHGLPVETFISRHLECCSRAGMCVILVGREDRTGRESGASIAEGPCSVPSKVLPNFDHLSSVGKLAAARWALAERAARERPVRDRAVLGFFRSLRPDVIHFHTLILGVLLSWVPEELGIPWTVSARGFDIEVFPHLGLDNRTAIVQVLRAATGIHAVCQDLAFQVQGLAGPIDVDVIRTPVPGSDRCDRAYGGTASLSFLSIGRFVWQKSLPDLVIALKGMNHHKVKARLVGSGPDMERVRHWVKQLNLGGRVSFEGRLGGNKINQLLADRGVLVQASISEGFSNVVAEAMVRGCPVFATDVGGTREVVKEGETGFLLRPFEPEQWPVQLEHAADEDLMKKVARNARDRALELFSPESHAEGFKNFFEKAHSSGGRTKFPDKAEKRDLSAFRPSRRPTIAVEGDDTWKAGQDRILRSLRKGGGTEKAHWKFIARGTTFQELLWIRQASKLAASVEILEGDLGAPENAAELPVRIRGAECEIKLWETGSLVATADITSDVQLDSLVRQAAKIARRQLESVA